MPAPARGRNRKIFVAQPGEPPIACRRVADEFIRVISDLHYGERASRIRDLAQLAPLVSGPSSLVLNGDTVDTRQGPDPERNRRCLAEVRGYFGQAGPKTAFITGNHDPEISGAHFLDLAGGRVFVSHGDILFEDIVPWSRDAGVLRHRIEDGLSALGPPGGIALGDLAAVFKRAAASVGQRHQTERNWLKYALKTAGDSAWPPWRLLLVLKAWRELPGRAAAFASRHRPGAGFFLTGHTHRPGIWGRQGGLVVINTGSLCRPFLGLAVDIHPKRLLVRRISERAGEFHPGGGLAEFRLPEP